MARSEGLKVIEFYVPTKFPKRVKWLPPQQRAKVIERLSSHCRQKGLPDAQRDRCFLESVGML
jgi:hypothetical protein